MMFVHDMNYSYSKLGSFTHCKRKYKFSYIEKIKVDIPNTVEAFMGSLVHKVLDKLYRDLQHSKLCSKEELLKYYEEQWKAEWDDNILIVKDYSMQNYLDMGARYIADYYEHYKPFDQYRTVGLETMSFLDLADGNKYHIRIDRLSTDGQGTYFVCDYKTNSRLSPQEDLDEDKQLAMYSLWVKKKYPDCKRVKLVWYFLAHDREMISERSEEQLLVLKSDTEKLISVIETTADFPVNVSRLCDWCVFKSLCPAWTHKEELSQKTLEEYKDDDGVKLVDAYSTLMEKRKALSDELAKIKEQLIEFSKQKGVNGIFGTDKKVSVKSAKEITFPPKQERDELNEHIKGKGLWDTYSELNISKLKKAVKEKEIELDDFIKEVESFKVTLSKS